MKLRSLIMIIISAILLFVTALSCAADEIPDTSASRLCMILIPEDMDQEDFLEQTEWDRLSSEYGFEIVILSCDWDDTETAAAYYGAAYDEIQEHEENPQIFLIGYEEGGDYAALEAISHTSRYNALVTLGGTGLPETIPEESETESIPLSVWIISKEKTPAIDEKLEYWKTADRIKERSMTTYQSEFSDVLYLPVTSTAGEITSDSSRMGIVVFSQEEEYYDSYVSEKTAENFITQVETDHVCFIDNIIGGEIKAVNDRHFTYNRLQLDGQQRDYWVYVPDAVNEGAKAECLIVCLHGNGATGEDMIFQTQWQETASENNCVLIYPSSLYKADSQHYWQNLPEELSFIRTIVNRVCESFMADRSRIYATGFSNGAAMAQDLLIRCSDIFAAAAMDAPAYFEKELYGPIDSEIHEAAVLYVYGTEDEYLELYDLTAEIDGDPAVRKLQYWEMLYGFEHYSYMCYQNGIFTTYTYRSLNNIPVCHWIRAEGRHHDYPAEDIPMFYEFLQHYTKGPLGELYYDGRLVVSRHTIGYSWDEYTGIIY